MQPRQATTTQAESKYLRAACMPHDEWWFRAPTLILKEQPEIVGDLHPRLVLALHALWRTLLERSAAEFARNGAPVVAWDGQPLSETPQQVVILNPVYVGALPSRARGALGEAELERCRHGLREHLPELDTRVRHVGRRMGLEPTLHPNLVNVIFVEDGSRSIRSLPSERKVMLIRMLMAKLVASKVLLVPYRADVDGTLAYEEVILGTLEGGHPTLDDMEAARRLMIFGSTRAVGGWTRSADFLIPRDYWQHSPAVRGLIDLGNYLGERGLLSNPVAIYDLVRDQRLAEMLIALLRYSRQAEGAFWAVDHNLRYADRRLPWAASGVFPLVTASGRHGTSKTELGPHDIVAVLPSEVGTVEVIPVGSEETKGPSVEAEEFTLPLRTLRTLNIDQVHGGLRLVERGGVEVPPVRAGVHLHRGFVPPTSRRVIVIPTDVEAFPHVGCGVDLMHEMSSDAMRRAVRGWEEGRREAVAALFYVPNHGSNVFLFWAPAADGSIPRDPFALFRELVDGGELTFVADVPQV